MRLSQKIAAVFLYGLLVFCNWLFVLANDNTSQQSAYSLERLILGLVTYAHVFTLMHCISFETAATSLPLVLLHVLVRNLLTFSTDTSLPDRGAAVWSTVLVTPLYYSTITLLRPHWRVCLWVFFYTSVCKVVAFNCDWRAASIDAAVDAFTGLVLFVLVHYSLAETRPARGDQPEIIDLDNFTTDSVVQLVEPNALDTNQVLANEVANWQTVVTGYRRSHQ